MSFYCSRVIFPTCHDRCPFLAGTGGDTNSFCRVRSYSPIVEIEPIVGTRRTSLLRVAHCRTTIQFGCRRDEASVNQLGNNRRTQYSYEAPTYQRAQSNLHLHGKIVAPEGFQCSHGTAASSARRGKNVSYIVNKREVQIKEV